MLILREFFSNMTAHKKKDKQKKISVNLTHTNIDLDISKENTKKTINEESDYDNSATLKDSNSHRLALDFNFKKKNHISPNSLSALHVKHINNDDGGGENNSKSSLKLTNASSFSSVLSNREKLDVTDFISQKGLWEPCVTKDSLLLPNNLIQENEK